MFQRRARARAGRFASDWARERRRRRARAGTTRCTARSRDSSSDPTAFRWTQSAPRAARAACATSPPARFAAPVSGRAASTYCVERAFTSLRRSPRENLPGLALVDGQFAHTTRARTPRLRDALERDARASESTRDMDEPRRGARRPSDARGAPRRRDESAKASRTGGARMQRRPNGARDDGDGDGATTRESATRGVRDRGARREGRSARGAKWGSFIESCGRAATGGACFGRSRSV